MEEESDQEDELRAAAAEDPERRDEGDDGGGVSKDLNGHAECLKDATLSWHIVSVLVGLPAR